MIAVDTSVWVDFLRDPTSTVRTELDGLLEDDQVLLPRPALVELLTGAGRHTLPVLRRTLGALETISPSADTWALVERWAVEGAGRGLRFGVGDLLIAACAAEHGAHLWTLDDDFEPMVRLRWIRRHRPRG